MARTWHVNVRLTRGGPEEVPDTGKSPVSAWEYLDRRGKKPGRAFNATEMHEGRGSPWGAKGHQGQIERALETCGNTARLLEHVVTATREDAASLVDKAEDIARTTFAYGNSHYHVWNNYLFTNYVVYDPADTTAVPFIDDHHDTAHAEPALTRPAGCDWSVFSEP